MDILDKYVNGILDTTFICQGVAYDSVPHLLDGVAMTMFEIAGEFYAAENKEAAQRRNHEFWENLRDVPLSIRSILNGKRLQISALAKQEELEYIAIDFLRKAAATYIDSVPAGARVEILRNAIVDEINELLDLDAPGEEMDEEELVTYLMCNELSRRGFVDQIVNALSSHGVSSQREHLPISQDRITPKRTEE